MTALSEIYQAFSVTPSGQPTLLLAGMLVATDDDLGSRLAQFEYLKRDGAELEAMGASAARFSFRMVLMGQTPLTPGGAPLTAGQRYLQLVQAQRTQPKCLLVHPRLGRWHVGWSKLRAHEQPQRAVDTIELTLEFIEDQVDAAIAAEQATPQARAGQVTAAAAELQTGTSSRFAAATSSYATARAVADQVNAVATAFASGALEVAQGQAANTPLDTQFGLVQTQVAAMQAALLATLPYSREPEVALTPLRHAAYMVEAYSRLLLDAVAEQRPVLISYTLGQAQSLDDVLLAVYGPQASAFYVEALSLNRIANPLWLQGGTRLRLLAPQVLQQ